MIGEKIGKLLVLGNDAESPTHSICRCECGRETSVHSITLKQHLKHNKKTLTCGICNYENYGKQFVGKNYGALKILEYRIKDSGNINKKKTVEVLCKCKCGLTDSFWRKASAIKKRDKLSCGDYMCKFSKRKYKDIKNHTTQKLTKDERRLRKRWWNIHRRCYDKNNTGYGHYGALGIGVSQEWHYTNPYGRLNFVKWFEKELRKPYAKKIKNPSVDRIDNNKDYSIDNCRLASNSMQTANQKIQLGKECVYKHIYNNYSGYNKKLIGYTAMIEYEYVRYRAYVSIALVKKLVLEETLILAYYIKFSNSLFFNSLAKLDFKVEIATLNETKLNSKFILKKDERYMENKTRSKKRYNKVVSYKLIERKKSIGYRSVKILIGNEVHITKISYNIEILRMFIHS